MLLPFLALCLGAAMTGAFFRPGAWYEALAKPTWTPPNWLFPPAWTILYLMIAVAGWLLWRNGNGMDEALLPLGLWLAQLLFNTAWSWLFFGKQRPDLALIDAGLMALSIAATILTAWPISPLAAALLLPYLAWVCFAFMLNRAIWVRMRAPAQEPAP